MSTKFLAYVKALPVEQREDLALRCDTSVEYLFQIGYGNRKPKAALAISLERETRGAVRCEDILPEADWAYLRTQATA